MTAASPVEQSADSSVGGHDVEHEGCSECIDAGLPLQSLCGVDMTGSRVTTDVPTEPVECVVCAAIETCRRCGADLGAGTW